jgi:hypothetical protein
MKIGNNYIMTIKSEDEVRYDRCSQLSALPATLWVRGILPFLTSWNLFFMRSVCKEWHGYVKESWHASFIRDMRIKLLTDEFC